MEEVIRALQTSLRGIQGLHERETYVQDSTTKAGLLVAITYLQAQVDLYVAQQGNEQWRELEATPATDDGDAVTDTRETSTGKFEPVEQAQQGNKKRKE